MPTKRTIEGLGTEASWEGERRGRERDEEEERRREAQNCRLPRAWSRDSKRKDDAGERNEGEEGRRIEA